MKFRTISSPQPGSTFVLLPGWATDYRIFDTLRFPSTVIVPNGLITSDISADLAGYLSCEGIEYVSLYGWSMGASAALRFGQDNPDIVEKVIVSGARPRYPRTEIEGMRDRLRNNKEACLADFYRRCFLPSQRDDYRRFKQTLLADYLAYDTSALLQGLDFLESSAFDESALEINDITIWHGAADVIAPASEIIDIARKVPALRLEIIAGASHAVFLHPTALNIYD